MSDNELRDKLASEYADKIRSSESGTAQDGFIAGWDAARANRQLIKDSINMLNIITSLSGENNQLHEQLEWSLRNEQQYKDELKASLERENQLRAEVKLQKEICTMFKEESEKHAKTAVDSFELINQLRAEIERLKEVIRDVRQLEGKALAQCEKLAEALEFYAGLIPHAEAIGLGEPNREMGLMPAKFGTVLLEALAEYRKTKGE